MRLSKDTLPNAQAQQPAYDRSAVTCGIVHLGMGNFHRAHQAIYVDDTLANDPSWGIVGVSLRRPDMQQAMAPQDGLFTLAVRSASGTEPRIVGSVLDVLTTAENGQKVMTALCRPATRLVTLTVTEKGYCRKAASGDLDVDHPAIMADLAAPRSPSSVPGLLVEALRARKANGTRPFTVLSCDNLPENGKTLAGIVVQYAQLIDPELANWITQEVAFPSSMVDRIVPATSDQDRIEIEALTGLSDAWPVVTEPFCQWVVEDNFPAGRPDFTTSGVQLVSDVRPYEFMKLRLLNGSHSTLAYLGQLLGHETVAEAMEDAALAAHIKHMMYEEIAPTLEMSQADLLEYSNALLARFENPTLHHRTAQIAMDGSQKIPQRLLGTIEDRHSKGESWSRLRTGVAAWLAYIGKADVIDDPLADYFADIKEKTLPDIFQYANAITTDAHIFGNLAGETWFTEPVKATLIKILTDGAASALIGEDA